MNRPMSFSPAGPEAAMRSRYRFVGSCPRFRLDHLADVTPFISERQIRVALIVPAVQATIPLENSGEEEVCDTSEERRRRQRHHPGQGHIANRRPAHAVQAFEKADSDDR